MSCSNTARTSNEEQVSRLVMIESVAFSPDGKRLATANEIDGNDLGRD